VLNRKSRPGLSSSSSSKALSSLLGTKAGKATQVRVIECRAQRQASICIFHHSLAGSGRLLPSRPFDFLLILLLSPFLPIPQYHRNVSRYLGSFKRYLNFTYPQASRRLFFPLKQQDHTSHQTIQNAFHPPQPLRSSCTHCALHWRVQDFLRQCASHHWQGERTEYVEPSRLHLGTPKPGPRLISFLL
jgi:hypothetical protein